MISSSSQSPSLPLLAVEVQLYIIDFLQSSSNEHDDEYENDIHYSWPPVSLTRQLPWLTNLINLSSTCKHFRDFLAPRIFQVLYLQNTVKSALSIKAIGEGKHAGCVEELSYVGICDVG